MDTTIRKLDEQCDRSIKARAAMAGKTVADVIDESVYAAHRRQRPGSFVATFDCDFRGIAGATPVP